MVAGVHGLGGRCTVQGRGAEEEGGEVAEVGGGEVAEEEVQRRNC